MSGGKSETKGVCDQCVLWTDVLYRVQGDCHLCIDQVLADLKCSLPSFRWVEDRKCAPSSLQVTESSEYILRKGFCTGSLRSPVGNSAVCGVITKSQSIPI